MDDEYYMEDEHEWPYLVRETRDDYRRNRKQSVHRIRDFKDFPFGEFSSYVIRLMISQDDGCRIIDSIDVKARKCICSIHQEDNRIKITLTLKNKYFSSEFIGNYDVDTCEMQFFRPFNNYTDLESMPWFGNEVKRIEAEIGLKFSSNGGGYDYRWKNDKLTINDEFEVLAYFSDENDHFADTHSYKIDFENRKLNKYHVHDWKEFFEPTFGF